MLTEDRCDVSGEILLNSEASGKGVDQAGEFAQSKDAISGKVGDAGCTEEGEEVMGAHGEELDLCHFDDPDDFLGVDFASRLEDSDGIDVIARHELLVRTCDAVLCAGFIEPT
jgi:hypothetical protein